MQLAKGMLHDERTSESKKGQATHGGCAATRRVGLNEEGLWCDCDRPAGDLRFELRAGKLQHLPHDGAGECCSRAGWSTVRAAWRQVMAVEGT